MNRTIETSGEMETIGRTQQRVYQEGIDFREGGE